jgi:hypothetical protein
VSGLLERGAYVTALDDLLGEVASSSRGRMLPSRGWLSPTARLAVGGEDR